MEIKKAFCASFDVDPQRGFTPLCPDELPVKGGDEIGDELNGQARFAAFRVVSKDCHPARAPWMASSPEEVMQPVPGDFAELDIKWPPHCLVGTEGNRLIPGLPEESSYDLVVEKGGDPLMHPYGACYHDLSEKISTGVIEWFRERKVDTVLLGGLATDFCVKTTALQLRRAGFAVVLNRAASRGVAQESCTAAFKEMEEAGVVFIDSCEELVSL
ncbi:MAG: isochorismatase family protein [Spirochaetales bacterium]|nr:isochorismatase family protein [Spirochaetales bacterium]